MTGSRFRICFISTCSNTLFDEKHLNQRPRAVTFARRSAVPWKQRRHHRRNHSELTSPHRRRRRVSPILSRCSELSQRLFRPPVQLDEPSGSTTAQCYPVDGPTAEHRPALASSIMEENLPWPAPPPRPRVGHPRSEDASRVERAPGIETTPLPSQDELVETRSCRSASTSSRSNNRLSITLPVAPPTAYPSRPTPTSSTMDSCPPTPVDMSALASPVEPPDFITAIAAQERRVLELREELSRAEHGLKSLKKQWAHQEMQRKRAEIRRTEPLRPLVAQADTSDGQDDDATVRRSVELDRRKALLLGQQSSQSTPTQSRRRVFRGGHARTLSLLPPPKTTGGFSIHEDQTNDFKSPVRDLDFRVNQAPNGHGPPTPAQLSKRASWAPRSVHHVGGLKQVADGLNTALWNLVEDLRQVTVGDEPISGGGAPQRGVDANARGNYVPLAEDQDTIRASGTTARPHVARAFDDTPTPPSRFADSLGLEKSDHRHSRRKSKVEKKATKHFSWAPLTADSLDDNDWSNWESPSVKSSRWSGTTVNEDAVPVPDNHDESMAPL